MPWASQSSGLTDSLRIITNRRGREVAGEATCSICAGKVEEIGDTHLTEPQVMEKKREASLAAVFNQRPDHRFEGRDARFQRRCLGRRLFPQPGICPFLL